MRRLLLAALAALLLATPALANDTRLDNLAATFAMRPYTIDCHTKTEDDILKWAWGYTFLAWDYAVMNAGLCSAVVAMLDGQPYDDWEAANGVLVLTHESYHGRLWYRRGSESAVECQAIRHFRVAARMLGVSEATIDRLWPWAAFFHYRIGSKAPEYASPKCVVPVPWS